MEIKIEEKSGTLMVRVDGRIDGITGPEFESRLTSESNRSAQAMVVNFEGVSYISSIGLRAVLLIARHLSQNDMKFALYGLGDLSREVFETSGFNRIVNIVQTEKEALAAVKAEG